MILVTGNGRGGTNLALEMLRASGQFVTDTQPEDRTLFGGDLVNENYLTKLAVEHPTVTLENINRFIEADDNFRVLFVFRHPYDTVMAKIYRGRPDGDNTDGKAAKDHDSKVAIEMVKKNLMYYMALKEFSPDRVFKVNMEDIILNTQSVANDLCNWFDLEFKKEMLEPWKYSRNIYHNKRYKQKPNKMQVGLFDRYDTIYGGYFKGRTLKTELENSGLLKMYNQIDEHKTLRDI